VTSRRIQRTWIVNIYAPPGAERKPERESFYNSDLPHLLSTTKTKPLLAGDFNCIRNSIDSTEQAHFSKALADIVKGFDLHDVWEASSSNHGYTHYAHMTASRLDRIYGTEQLYASKQGVETVATAFTDHFAMIFRLAIDIPLPTRGRRALENECILPTREDLPRRAAGAMGEMAAAQEILSQHCHMVGTKR
jgi:exonuclease III